jgi:hypothetical protein
LTGPLSRYLFTTPLPPLNLKRGRGGACLAPKAFVVA